MVKFLVFGLIHQIGIGKLNVEKLFDYFKNGHSEYSYEHTLINLSDEFGINDKDSIDYRDRLINFGNNLREYGSKDILSIYAILEIFEKLKGIEEEKVQIFIIYSLKNNEEIERLRNVFGDNFYLMGLQLQNDEEYKNNLIDETYSDDNATNLIKRDKKESGNEYGQRVLEIYHNSDYFLNIDQDKHLIKEKMDRFLDLINKNPYITPTKDEHFMNIAFITSTRSLSLGRRVGAVIVSENNDILATGCNEVPKYGGGQYWPDDKNEAREYTLMTKLKLSDIETNQQEIKKMKDAVIDNFFSKNNNFQNVQEIKENLKSSLKEIDCITEFMREVHAEAECIHSCARNGIKTINSKLYCTTYPCHYCAKHIVSVGIREVFYIQPYEKSRAKLFDDSITFKGEGEKVKCVKFNGIGPNKYSKLFIPASSDLPDLKRKDKEGKLYDMTKKEFLPPIISLDLIETKLKETKSIIENLELSKLENSITLKPNDTLTKEKAFLNEIYKKYNKLFN